MSPFTFTSDSKFRGVLIRMVRRRAGYACTMVVWTQRSSLLSHHALPGADVLLSTKGGKPSCVFLPALDHSLLVTHIHLHLGRATPLVVYITSRLGAVAGCGLFSHWVLYLEIQGVTSVPANRRAGHERSRTWAARISIHSETEELILFAPMPAAKCPINISEFVGRAGFKLQPQKNYTFSGGLRRLPY